MKVNNYNNYTRNNSNINNSNNLNDHDKELINSTIDKVLKIVETHTKDFLIYYETTPGSTMYDLVVNKIKRLKR